MKTVTAYGTTVQVDRSGNRFVMRSPDGSCTTYPFVPMGTLLTTEQVRLATEGLSQEQARLVAEALSTGLPRSGVGFGMVQGATVIAPGVAYGISEVVGGSSTHRSYWILGRPTAVGVPTEGGDGYKPGSPIFSPDSLLAVSSDQLRFLSHSVQGLKVFHLDEARVVRIASHRTADGDFAFDRDLRVVVTTVADGTVVVSDTATGACAAKTQVQDRRLRNVTLSDNGEQVAFRGVERSWVWQWRSEPSAAPIGPAAPVGPAGLWSGLVSRLFTRR